MMAMISFMIGLPCAVEGLHRRFSLAAAGPGGAGRESYNSTIVPGVRRR